MVYEHDPEFPFQKILVKNCGYVIGIIRRNHETGHYQFFDIKMDSLSPLFRATRLDIIKSWIETKYLLPQPLLCGTIVEFRN